MAIHKYVVRRDEKYPFLTMSKLREGDAACDDMPVIKLSGDEVEDYEIAMRNFSGWQRRLADVDGG
jgi:hypothetical protein